MKVSEGMMLGVCAERMLALDWNNCALGAYGNACGVPKGTTEVFRQTDANGTHEVHICQVDGRDRAELIFATAPWLRELYVGTPLPKDWNKMVSDFMFGIKLTYAQVITWMFDNFVALDYPILAYEQLVDWVRSIEPSCGHCNQFDCKGCSTIEQATEQEVFVGTI